MPSSSYRHPLCLAGLVLWDRRFLCRVLYARIYFLTICCRSWQIFGRAWQILVDFLHYLNRRVGPMFCNVRFKGC